MNNEVSQTIDEYLATLERDIRYLEKEINSIDSYEGKISNNEIMLDLLTKNLLFIKKRQDIMNRELELALKKVAETKLTSKEYVVFSSDEPPLKKN